MAKVENKDLVVEKKIKKKQIKQNTSRNGTNKHLRQERINYILSTNIHCSNFFYAKVMKIYTI